MGMIRGHRVYVRNKENFRGTPVLLIFSNTSGVAKSLGVRKCESQQVPFPALLSPSQRE